MVRFSIIAMISLSATAAQAAVSIDMVTVGDPGNAASTYAYGSVPYTFQIGKFETTAGQYTEFLNAVSSTDTYGLYDSRMGSAYDKTGIMRSGNSGSYTYSVASNWADRPVNYVDYWDASRFVNWLHNGQPTGSQNILTTEDGAYTLNGYTGSGGAFITRNAVAKYWLPNGDEWYKAGHYKGGGTDEGYWKYPTQSNTLPSNQRIEPDPGNNANYAVPGNTWPPPPPPGTTIGGPYFRTKVGEFENSEGPYGTFDQAGNVCEWFETLYPNGNRGLAGSAWNHSSKDMGGDWENIPDQTHYPPYGYAPTQESGDFGFRVASIPEPSTLVILLGGVVALGWRRRRRSRR